MNKMKVHTLSLQSIRLLITKSKETNTQILNELRCLVNFQYIPINKFNSLIHQPYRLIVASSIEFSSTLNLLRIEISSFVFLNMCLCFFSRKKRFYEQQMRSSWNIATRGQINWSPHILAGGLTFEHLRGDIVGGVAEVILSSSEGEGDNKQTIEWSKSIYIQKHPFLRFVVLNLIFPQS